MQGRPDRGLAFRSPLAPLASPPSDVAQVRRLVEERARPVRGLRARMEMLVGASRRNQPRQRFEALAFFDPPTFLRVRAIQNGVAVFDLLVDADRATLVVVPERTVWRGSLRELRQAPRLTAGIAPDVLLRAIDIDNLLTERLRENQPRASFSSDFIELAFDTSHDKEEEQFVLRRSDLLVQRYVRLSGRRRLSEVRYWAYEKMPGGGVYPTQFAVENAAGGAFLVRLNEVRVGEKREARLATIDIPEGFVERSFSEADPK